MLMKIFTENIHVMKIILPRNAYVLFDLFVYSLETYKYKYAEENLSSQPFRGGKALFIR